MPRRQSIVKPKRPKQSVKSLSPSDRRSKVSVKRPKPPMQPRKPRP